MPAMNQFAVLGAVIFLYLCAELTVRYWRLADYIRYRPAADIGYAPQPNSSGSFRRRYRWRFNSIGIRTDEDAPVEPDSLVLVGDSIVEGGAKVGQEVTLGYLVSQRTGKPVHPVGAGGWTLENEFAFLRKHPELLSAGVFVMVTNSDDLRAINPWSSHSTHPTSPPISHLAYLVRRFSWPNRQRLLARLGRRPVPGASGPGGNDQWMRSVSAFLEIYQGRLIWVLYPDRTEFAGRIAPCQALRPLIAGRAETVELLHLSGWGLDCYHDRLHPNDTGRKLLADTISAVVLGAADGSEFSVRGQPCSST